MQYAVSANVGPLIAPSLAQSDREPLLIAVNRSDAAGRLTKTHHHSRGQLLGATAGLLAVTTQEGQWVVPAVHGIWLPPHHPHAAHSHGRFSGWSVYIAEAACMELPNKPYAIRTSGLLREAIARAATWDTSRPLEAAQAAVAQVIIGEICTSPQERIGLPMPCDPRLCRIAHELVNDLANSASLEDWALWAGIPTRTLTRRFVAETGFTFSQWRQRARLIRSLELLAAGEAVTTIAGDLGYSNVSAFISMFARTFNVTPSRYLISERDRT